MTRFFNKIFAATLIIFLALTNIAIAQIQSATLGINGLTCSQCCRSVEMQLRSLAFVQAVEMSLKETEATIKFKNNKPIDFSLIPKAVKDAGFSTRFLQVVINTEKADDVSAGWIATKGNVFNFAVQEQVLSGSVKCLLLGKTYGGKQEDITTLKASNANTPFYKGKQYWVKIIQ